jgi:hypothetical protein
MYLVKLPDEVRKQLAALPSTALAAFAEVMVVLAVAPWGGDPYNRERPEGNIRTVAFGEHAERLLVYLVVEHAREVGVIELMWAG